MKLFYSQRNLGFLIIILGVAAIALAILITPNVATMYLSRDHFIPHSGLKLLDNVRLFLSLGGILMLICGFILTAMHNIFEKLQSLLLFFFGERRETNFPVISISILVFTSLGLIAFPFAVYSQQHLYADGAVYTANLLETGRMYATGFFNRFLGYTVVELPTFLLLHIGISNISALSRIYGASLYYFPYLCYALAACLLFRKGMDIHAILLVLMWLILTFFTSYYMNQDQQLASGLFVLSLAIIATCNIRDVTTLLVLLFIGTIATACYEFWAIFFPVCIALFLSKCLGQAPIRPAVKSLQGLLVLLYIAGCIVNIVGSFSPTYAAERQEFLFSFIYQALPIVLASCLFFGLVVLLGCFSSMIVRVFKLDQRICFRSGSQPLHQTEKIFPLVMLVTFAVSLFLFFEKFPRPEDAFALRSLHLFLPLLFAASFLFPNKRTSSSAPAHTIAVLCVLPLLILTMQASLFQTTRWLDFKRSFYSETQQQSGFVSIEDVPISNSSFLWGWTSPTLSILFQALQGRNVRSIFFNPKAPYQPYDQTDSEHAIDLAKHLHVNVLFANPNNLINATK